MKKVPQRTPSNIKPDNRRQSLDKIVKLLTEVLKLNGFTIRREELKRGFGWKAVSGSCRIEEGKIIFVDRKMSIEDQVGFLSGYAMVSAPGFIYPDELREQLEVLEWSAPSLDSAQALEAANG